MGKLDNKIAVITGCSGGLGKQIALRFASEGAKLAICARSEDRLAATKEACEKLGAETLAMKVDLSDYDQLKSFADAVIEKFTAVDILVNNAVSITPPHPFLEHTLDELNMTMHSGLYATWHLMKLFYPYMKGRNASVINFGSGAGDLGLEGYAAYASTKEAIRGLSRVAAREWGKDQIRVNIVNPSAVTDNVKAGIEMLPEEMKAYVNSTLASNPMCRPGDPYEDITPAIVFLASDESRWVSGQTLMVEGGGNIHA